MGDNDLALRIRVRLTELEAISQNRGLRVSRGIDLSSNDYLGLSVDRRLKASVADAVAKCERISSTGSRLLSGHAAAWDQLEEEFAAFAGTEAALFFSSGYAANVGLLSSLLGPDDLVFSDALNHASIIDGILLSHAKKIVYPHRDLNFLEDGLRRNTGHCGARLIVTESIFSMDGDRAPLAGIFELASRYGAEVIVDEAHATAVCGPRGRGLVAELDLNPFAVVHACGKALASMGGVVCGSDTLRRFLINHARSFIFSTALPPYLAHQALAALRLANSMEDERNHLAAISTALREGLRGIGQDCGSSSSHIVPIVVGSNESALALAAFLEESGFVARPIRPPTVPEGTSRLRLSLTSRLTNNDIERLIAAVSAGSQMVFQHG